MGRSLLLIDYGDGANEIIVVLNYWTVAYITAKSQYFDITNKSGNKFSLVYSGTGISQNFIVKRIDIIK